MYKRILLKISGEIFLNEDGSSFDFEKYKEVAVALKEFVSESKVQLAIVLGAGNIWRYRDTKGARLDRVTADQLGMTATTFNAKILEGALNGVGLESLAVSDFSVPGLMPDYDAHFVNDTLNEGVVCILAGGTGKPYFTTDSCATLRALELGCDILLKATKVDGVYDSDPHKNDKAKRFDKISYAEVLEKSLEVMDLTAISLAKEAQLPLLVFDFTDFNNLKKVVKDSSLGTLVN